VRPEIVEIMFSLPQINSDTKKFMRQDGNEGLEFMAVYIARSHAVRAPVRVTRKCFGKGSNSEANNYCKLWQVPIQYLVPRLIERLESEFF
jgi:hypothetical protein